MSELSFSGWAARWPQDAYWRSVQAEVARDAPIHAIILAHALAALVLALVLGRTENLVYLAYVDVLPRCAAVLGMLYIVLVEAPASIRANPSRPLQRLIGRLPELFNPRLPAAILLILGLTLMMGSFTSMKTLLPAMVGFHWDAPLAAADAWLHGGQDPWRLLQPVLGHHPVTRGVQIVYTAGWTIALGALPAAVAASRRLEPIRLQFFLTYLFCWIVLGNLAAGFFMSAGPVYFGQVTGDVARFADQLAYLSFSEGMSYSSHDAQRILWFLHEQGRTQLGSGISAFPSLHVAMAALFAAAAWSINRWAGWIGTAFLAVILLGSVHLAWHYALDGYVSIAATAAAWLVIGAWLRRRASAIALRPQSANLP